MFHRLEKIENRYSELGSLMGNPEIVDDQTRFRRIAQEYADLGKLVNTYRDYKKVSAEIEDNLELIRENDEEIKQLAQEDIQKLETRQGKLEKELKILLVPRDPLDKKNIYLEIRAGTGGEEAALFAATLFRMYAKYAELKRWKVEIVNENTTGLGGFKEVISLISGKNVYSRLKYESGVHRVQRVPATESQGRVHTSAVTIAILPEAEEVEVEMAAHDLKIDVYRSSGPGGQSVNTTDSAVRITHLPSGLVVCCQDEKSQHKNKAKALRILRARLLDHINQERDIKISAERKNQVGSGDRSERIRTYNFSQDRVSDHRIGLTLHKLESILEGNLDEIIDPLITHYQTEALKKSFGG